MLKLDDLLTEEPTFTFENTIYHFDFSLKAMLKFQKWSQNQTNETNLDNHVEDLLKILIQEFDQFWLKFKDLFIIPFLLYFPQTTCIYVRFFFVCVYVYVCIYVNFRFTVFRCPLK